MTATSGVRGRRAGRCQSGSARGRCAYSPTDSRPVGQITQRCRPFPLPVSPRSPGSPAGRTATPPVCPDVEAAAYLRGLAAGHTQQAAAVRVESVWSGPGTHQVPVRATAQVLVDLVGEATRELMLMTYSAKPYPPLLGCVDRSVGAGGDCHGGRRDASRCGQRAWRRRTGRRVRIGARCSAVALADRPAGRAFGARCTPSSRSPIGGRCWYPARTLPSRAWARTSRRVLLIRGGDRAGSCSRAHRRTSGAWGARPFATGNLAVYVAGARTTDRANVVHHAHNSDGDRVQGLAAWARTSAPMSPSRLPAPRSLSGSPCDRTLPMTVIHPGSELGPGHCRKRCARCRTGPQLVRVAMEPGVDTRHVG